ncbi:MULTISPECIES: hypothetical protein [Streptomyces]|jgi:hypothetical protein|uniref:Uncharacterized protein n=1 Tax=Streptomyces fradiae ATCC 10745 = DSM 40063 TaxID=1319510 RepID=A0A1Y2NUN5_STRFR|nr:MULTISPECIES: hypothetical protein [Streptomyces]KAF0650457.1 hypothetical protein K701_07760 [Streptomyces fradiae ATCC 10745 = DSM 40063]OSY51215.1 hypothetical protein BG846_03135 [Streptomyces fradiae ATCC 10745 = DSM 40063]QEV14677.1 hypothetical protein CP974_24885 [Streptomyces fradiae ATCC 10745 = DSM 40063]
MADDTGIQDPARARRGGSAPFLFVVVESAVTTLLALSWLVTALAMYLESSTAVPGARVPEGHGGLAWAACGVLGSVVVTWLLRLVPGHVLRHAVDGVAVLRLVAVLVVTAVLFLDLVDG